MAWVFVRLKASLLLNGLRGERWRVVFVLIGGLYGLGVAGTGFAVMVAAGANPADGPTIAVLIGTALAVGWTAVSLLGLGSDGAVDPVRLSLLPLSRTQLMAGLLAAGFVGVGAAVTGVVLLGAVIGFAPAGPGAGLVALAGAAQLLVCVCGSRAVLAWLSAALRSRRGRDVRLVVVAVILVAPQAARLAAGRGTETGWAGYRGVADVAGWLPTGLPMRAMVAASRGRLLVGLGELVLSGAVILGLVWWWAASLERMMTTAEAAPAVRAERRARTGEPLFGAILAWLPRTRVGAVAARELRSTWRDPRRRVQVVTSALLPFIVLAGLLTRGVSHRTGLVYTALLVVGLSGAGRGYNQLGFDGRAWWLHEACGADLAADLRGKNLALVVTTVPVVALAAVILAALTGSWLALVTVVPLALGLEGVQLAIGNVLSVQAPWSVPQSATNLWATGSGQGCLVGILGLAGMAVQVVIALPFVVTVVVVTAPVARVVIALVAVAYGYAVWVLGSRWAVRLGAGRGPEILAAASGGQAPT